MLYYIIAKYKSKYGTILYATKVDESSNFDVDMSNVYINTLYLKGSADIKVNELVELQTIKGENGLTYCFK